jgi:uncharacterized protein YmfQ (DUF2313 family)
VDTVHVEPDTMPGARIVPARYPAAAYADVLRKLLPRGRVWTREDEGTQAAVLDGLACIPEGIDSEALTLLAAAFPGTADQLLPEWDKSLGLPDACFGPFTSAAQNREQVVAKFIGTGGQSVAYFESLAASLGCPITITEFAVHTVIRPVTAPIAGTDWAFGWLVTVSDTTTSSPHYHAVGDPVEDALSSMDTTPTVQILECLLRRYAPAQTVLVFNYAQDAA